VPQKVPTKSRAVLRSVDAGCSATCVHCNQPVKFSAKERRQQVICNVYIRGRWNRVEHYHYECYVGMDQPYGEAS